MPIYVFEDKKNPTVRVEVSRSLKRVDGSDKTSQELDLEIPTEEDCKEQGVKFDSNREWFRVMFGSKKRYYYCDSPPNH